MKLVYDEIVQETNKAVLVRFDDIDIWLPLSQVDVLDDEHIEVPPWLAEQKGIEDYEE